MDRVDTARAMDGALRARPDSVEARLSAKIFNLFALNKAAQVLTSVLDLSSLAEMAVDVETEIGGARNGALYLDEADGGAFGLAAAKSGRTELFPSAFDRGDPLPRAAAHPRGRAVLAPFSEGGSESAGLALAVPVRLGERLLGFFTLLDPIKIDAWNEDDVEVLETLAAQVAVCVQNARLYRQVNEQYEALKTQHELERLNAELQRANQVKSQFLASMSHELRTPLNAIIGFTEVLLSSAREPVTARQRGALEKVHRSGKHLLGLINDILDLSKIEAGRMEPRPVPFELAPVLRESLDAVEPLAQKKDLLCRAVGLEGAPEIVQDPAKVKQIVLNLLSNAVKFTTEGSIELRFACDGGSVVVSVSDTGVGIAPEHAALVFDPFRQVDGNTTKDAGTGLGLTISRRLAQLMGGTLDLHSVPGQGSTFTLRLPLHCPGAAPS